MTPSKLKQWWRLNVSPRQLTTRTVRHFIPYHDLQKAFHYWPATLPTGLKRPVMMAALHHAYTNLGKIPSATRGYGRQVKYTSLALSMYRSGGPYPDNNNQPSELDYVPTREQRDVLDELILSLGASYFSKLPREETDTAYACYSTTPAPGWRAEWVRGLRWVDTGHGYKKPQHSPAPGITLSWTEYAVDGEPRDISDIVNDIKCRMRALGAAEVTIAKFETALTLNAITPGKDYDTWLEATALRTIKVYGR